MNTPQASGRPEAVPYNHAGLQKERIKPYLVARGALGALGSEIGTACNVPCVTKRISELRRSGVRITTRQELLPGPHGVNWVTRYFLLEPDGRQLQLDLAQG